MFRKLILSAALALAAISPARAAQNTIVTATSGPLTMSAYATALNAALLAIQSCNSGTSAPANGPSAAPVTFQCWADTSASPVITFKRYDGAQWVAFGSLDTSTHVWTAVSGSLTFPTSADTLVGRATTDTLTNKSIGGSTNTFTPADNKFTLQDNGDATKQAAFELSGISTGTTRTFTLPNTSTTVVGTDATQTLTNKTLTSPTINSATITGATIDGTTTFPTTGVSAGTYGDGSNVAQITVNASGRITAASNVAISGGGGGSYGDTERRDALVSLAYQSKALAEYRRNILKIATGFNGASDALNGINTGSSSNYSVTTSGAGTLSPTKPEVVIAQGGLTKIGDFSTNNSAISDGNTNQDNTAAANTTSSIATARYGVDLGVGVTKVITGLKTWGGNNRGYAGSGDTSNITITLKAANVDPVTNSWTGTTIGTVATFANSAATNAKTSLGNSNTTAFRWVWVEISKPSATSMAMLAEAEFYETYPANMTVVTTSQTEGSSVSNGRALIGYDDTCGTCNSVTLNTDVTVEVQCNGSSWHAATLTAVTGNVGTATQFKLAETADTGCTSGTSSAVRLKTLNNKFLNFYLLTHTVH